MNDKIRLLPQIISWCILMLFITGCKTSPKKTTEQFLSDLQNGKYANVAKVSSPNIKKQIAIIQQDKFSLYAGQKWSYGHLTEKTTNNGATVSYAVTLNDGTKIHQQAVLSKLANNWMIDTIHNIKISNPGNVLGQRNYPDNPAQILAVPLTIDSITTLKLSQHIGQFVLVSGNICGFEPGNTKLIMTMGQDDLKPLLYVTVTGSAKTRAIKDHGEYMQTDKMVESPLGNTFTAIGLLKYSRRQFSIDVTDAQNIIIGPILRVEKR